MCLFGISENDWENHFLTAPIISFSLGDDTNFIFRNPNTDEKIELYDPGRSIIIMPGDSRNIWTHEIPKRKTVTLDNGSTKKKGNNYRRVSLTYRTVINR